MSSLREALEGAGVRALKPGERLTHRPTPEEIDAAMTPAGGWTKAQLAQWGVPWPPPRGWRKRLEAGGPVMVAVAHMVDPAPLWAWLGATKEGERLEGRSPISATSIETWRDRWGGLWEYRTSNGGASVYREIGELPRPDFVPGRHA